MKEIGGYFGLEELVSNEYYKELIPLNNGRNALLYILKVKKVKKVYIPYYLCNSISSMLMKNGYDFECYHIDSEFMPIFDKILLQDEYIDVVNFYGQITDEKAMHLKQKYKNIILDNTQAFFQKPIRGIISIYSCRKFFGVPDGAYLSIDEKINFNIEVDVSKERMTHILGRYEGSASEYYNFFNYNDELYEFEPLKYMSKLTHNILGAIDYEKVRSIRNKNYAYLKNKLDKFNKLKLRTPDGPFCYPFYIENGIEIRKALARKKIYIPMLWPNVLNDTTRNSVEFDYVSNILPIPCDQRYQIKEMIEIINNLKELNVLQNI